MLLVTAGLVLLAGGEPRAAAGVDTGVQTSLAQAAVAPVESGDVDLDPPMVRKDGSVTPAPGPASFSLPAGPIRVERYIVRYRDGVDAEQETAALSKRVTDADVVHVYEHVFDGFAADLPEEEVERLRSDPRVLSVDEDAPVRLYREDEALRASAIQAGAPWGLDRIDQRNRPLSGTYAYPNSGSGVTVYVIDTGIRSDHVEFAGRVLSGYTSILDGRGAYDCNGHGTHVAGTVGGSVYGVAKAVSLRPVRVLDCKGTGSVADVIAGLNWIVKDHAAGEPAVANLSLGGDGSSTLDSAVQAVLNDGVTVVAAAGNDGYPACYYSPGRVPGAVTVAATNATDYSPNWSNYGSCLDLFAPGVDIRSASHTSTTGTVVFEGTSMAAPHVAGAAAVLLAAEPSRSPSQVASLLNANATPGLVTNPGTGSPNRLLYSPPGPTPSPGPANDQFVTATTLSLTGPNPVSGSNVNATKQPGEPDHAGGAGGRSVWWRFTAPADGSIALSTQGSGFDTLLAAYTGGDVSSLTALAANDDDDDYGYWSRIEFNVTAGSTYHVAVDGSGGSSGSIALGYTWKPLVAPGTAASYVPLTPGRVFDSRSGSKLAAGATRQVRVTGVGGVPASGVGAVVLNITGLNATAGGYVTVWPAGQPRPLASTFNPRPGGLVSNEIIAKVGTKGQVSVYNHQGSVDVFVDVVGWLPAQ